MKFHLLDLIYYKVYADLRAEASRTYIGVFWWILEPFLYMAVFYFVFGTIFNRGGGEYAFFLLSGLVVWRWFSSSVQSGSNSILANSNLTKQVSLPQQIFPIIQLASVTIKFLISFFIFLALIFFFSDTISITWLTIPIVVFVQLLLNTALALLFAGIIPFFKDLRVLIDNALLLLFFMSGIFFDLKDVPESVQSYLMLNPMFSLIHEYRLIILNNTWPNSERLLIIGLVSILFIIFSSALISRLQGRYAKVLT